MEKLNSVFLSLGSDLENKISNLKKAMLLIELKIGPVVKTSSVYESEPWGFESQTRFYNMAVELNSELSPQELLNATQSIEKQIGRSKKSSQSNYESRLIDIDIIFYNDLIHSDTKLTIPHPLFQERNFVLYPLEEISPNKTDPITSFSVRQLMQNSPDTSEINVIKEYLL
tara:strand:+ start:3519 stop:4031 length:513 start_codon:yes stop_codon:yes gene_type:complete